MTARAVCENDALLERLREMSTTLAALVAPLDDEMLRKRLAPAANPIWIHLLAHLARMGQDPERHDSRV